MGLAIEGALLQSATISAAISSRCGIVRCFSGAMRVFASTNDMWLLVCTEDDNSIGVLACINKAVNSRLCGRRWEVVCFSREL